MLIVKGSMIVGVIVLLIGLICLTSMYYNYSYKKKYGSCSFNCDSDGIGAAAIILSDCGSIFDDCHDCSPDCDCN
ncbi:hypothetical protein D3C73_1615550 [compost metagenome]